MASALPDKPDLRQLRNQAKDLLKGNLDAADYLFDRGADINVVNETGSGHLHAIAYLSQSYDADPAETIPYLVTRGIDVNLISKENLSPLDLTMVANNDAVIALLKAHGGKTRAELEAEQP